MSHHSDDAVLGSSSNSFWEPGNYKRTTRRIDDGFKLCNDLVQLIQERAEIEKAYGKSLKGWSRKWNDLIEKGPEYGTTEAAWKGVLSEADRVCDMHLRVRDRLINEVVTNIKQWQKDNFHKSVIHLKEKKEMDDAFKKAQKTWAKMLDKVNKHKADYHTACKNEKTASNLERNANGDTSFSPDQVKKLQDRVCRCKEEVQRSKERYEVSLREINDYNAKYMEDMKVVFDKCQDLEEKRLLFFKEMLFGIHSSLNISTDPDLPNIYEDFRLTIQNADASKDLKWWSNNHGFGMAMNWPQFEDYSEEFRDIAGRSKKGTLPESGIMLVNQQRFSDDLPKYNPEVHSDSKKEKKSGTGSEPITPVHNELKMNGKKVHNNGTAPQNGGGQSDEEDWEENNTLLVDTGEPGVPVRALYDYVGQEADELSFKQGEMFDKLEDEDDQGWCKGRKDGRVGLYPANYVEVIQG
ncbi:PACSIN3 [Cordylochernes scorpioides]|uniref:PACSIN3 n=1 Tax=Cordylochernes scorpioides TaxID=51811 RepID=A0ABY6JWY5_9ARAC|nr:PACSIN3 [Cordylochernes scorpioides]